MPRCSTVSYRGRSRLASDKWREATAAAEGSTTRAIRHPSSISALRRAMTRDAGPLPGRISAFTTGLQSYTATTAWQAATLFPAGGL